MYATILNAKQTKNYLGKYSSNTILKSI